MREQHDGWMWVVVCYKRSGIYRAQHLRVSLRSGHWSASGARGPNGEAWQRAPGEYFMNWRPAFLTPEAARACAHEKNKKNLEDAKRLTAMYSARAVRFARHLGVTA